MVVVRSPRSGTVTRPKRPSAGALHVRPRAATHAATRSLLPASRPRARRERRQLAERGDRDTRLTEREDPGAPEHRVARALDELGRAEQPADALGSKAEALGEARRREHVVAELARAPGEDAAVVDESIERRIHLVDEQVRAVGGRHASRGAK